MECDVHLPGHGEELVDAGGQSGDAAPRRGRPHTGQPAHRHNETAARPMQEQVREMTERVMETILSIAEANREAHRVPEHATFGEVRRHMGAVSEVKLRDALNALWSDGAIGTGRTINDIYITINR